MKSDLYGWVELAGAAFDANTTRSATLAFSGVGFAAPSCATERRPAPLSAVLRY